MSKKPKKDKHKFNYGGRYETVADVRRWSFTAVECYVRKCTCKDCFYEGFFKKTREDYDLGNNYNCKMKATVLELIRTFGPPDLNAPYALGIQKDVEDE